MYDLWPLGRSTISAKGVILNCRHLGAGSNFDCATMGAWSKAQTAPWTQCQTRLKVWMFARLYNIQLHVVIPMRVHPLYTGPSPSMIVQPFCWCGPATIVSMWRPWGHGTVGSTATGTGSMGNGPNGGSGSRCTRGLSTLHSRYSSTSLGPLLVRGNGCWGPSSAYQDAFVFISLLA